MTSAPSRFGRRLAVVAIVLAVGPLAVVGFVLLRVNRDALRDGSRELLFAVTDDLSHRVAATLDGARASLVAVAGVLATSEQGPAQRVAAARAIVAAGPLDGVVIFDAAGARVDAILASGAAWPGPATLDADLRARADRDGIGFGPVAVVADAPLVPLVVPIAGDGARWYAVAGVGLDAVASRLAEVAHERFGDRYDAVAIVDRQLRYVIHADPERLLQPAPRAGVLAGLDPAAIEQGVLIYRGDDDDGDAVGVVRSLPGLPWAVVAQLPRAVVFAPAERARTWTLVATAVAALLIGAAAIALARRASAPVRTLVGLAQDLGARRFGRTVTLRTGDELETLATAMSAAGLELADSERRLGQEAAIRADLGRYLPAQLVERVVRREQTVALGGDRRRVTVLFADVAAFTALAEREPPDKVVALLNQLFTLLTEIVFRHGGTVDKLIGDCLMAFWGSPDDEPAHAARAVAAASDMQRWMDVANDCWEVGLGVTICLAIGVHTGEAIVGNFGSETRMEYTCVGDTVNVAARLETLARPQQILISEATRQELGGAVRCVALGSTRLPGRLAPVEVHEVVL